jgi:hypothetical protein
MTKKIIIILLTFFSLNFVFAQENQIITSLREKMLNNIKNLNQIKNKVLDESADISLNYEPLIAGNLKDVFNYNQKKIMYKEEKFEEIDAPTLALHKSYVNMLNIRDDKVYVSDLVLINGLSYYFLGCKNNKKIKLFLFKLENNADFANPYAIINLKGDIFFSNNVTYNILKPIITKINDKKTQNSYYQKNNIFKFKFFPYNDIYYFIEFNQPKKR